MNNNRETRRTRRRNKRKRNEQTVEQIVEQSDDMEIDNYIKDNTIVYSEEEDNCDNGDETMFNKEAALLGQETGLSYEESVKIIEENRLVEKRNTNNTNNTASQIGSNDLKSKHWGLLSQLTPEILHIAVNIMFEETLKSETNGGYSPMLEYVISLANDTHKDILKKKQEDEKEDKLNKEREKEKLYNDKDRIRELRLNALQK